MTREDSSSDDAVQAVDGDVGMGENPHEDTHRAGTPEARLQRSVLQLMQDAPPWATAMYLHDDRTCFTDDGDKPWSHRLQVNPEIRRLCTLEHPVDDNWYDIIPKQAEDDIASHELHWEPILLAWLKGDTNDVDFSGIDIPERLQLLLPTIAVLNDSGPAEYLKMLPQVEATEARVINKFDFYEVSLHGMADPARGIHPIISVSQKHEEGPSRPERYCGRREAHGRHYEPCDGDEGDPCPEPFVEHDGHWCPGLKAHPSVMIGRT